VMFCDLADSTALSTKLDPEDLQEVIRAAPVGREDGALPSLLTHKRHRRLSSPGLPSAKPLR
jgi:hypothetical protein